MIRKYGGQRRGDRQGTHLFMLLFEFVFVLSHTSSHLEYAFNRQFVSIRFPLLSDFLGRLQPSKAAIQKNRGSLRVEESSYPRKVLHLYSSNSSRSSGSFPRSLLEKLPNNRILNNSLFVQGQAARLCRHMLPGLIITCARGHLPSGHYYLRSLSLDLQALLLPRI